MYSFLSSARVFAKSPRSRRCTRSQPTRLAPHFRHVPTGFEPERAREPPKACNPFGQSVVRQVNFNGSSRRLFVLVVILTHPEMPAKAPRDQTRSRPADLHALGMHDACCPKGILLLPVGL